MLRQLPPSWWFEMIDQDNSKVTFLYAYDKSDMSNVSDAKIMQIIADNNLEISNN